MDISRLITVFCYLILLVLAFRVVLSCNRKLDYIGWVFLALHGLVFYLVIVIIGVRTDGYLFSPQFYNLWSTALRIHSLIVAILTLQVIYRNLRGKRRGC